MGLKEFVQNSIHEKYLKAYKKEVLRQRDSYGTYINVQEKADLNKLIPLSDARVAFENLSVIQYSELGNDLSFLDGACPFILFVNGDGLLAEKAERVICNAFEDDPELNIIYFDEDEYDKKNDKRLNPWFKADWSPNTLLNHFYFGNILAIRKSIVNEEKYRASDIPLENLYNIVLECCFNNYHCDEALHMPMVLFHRYLHEDDINNENGETNVLGLQREYMGGESLFDDVKIAAYERLGLKAKFYEDAKKVSHSLIGLDRTNNEKISIIIPSKDHPDVLKRCVASIREKSSYDNYEIIVIDNGSGEDNKLTYVALSKEYDFFYFYEKMDFNFSKMCNIGVKSCTGQYVLLLNDDTEIVTENWMEIMLGQARVPGVGAVGAKLYYPDGETLQHIGITNMTEGPSHKLQLHKDDKMIYHGVNRFDRDVIGVTAACLLVEKEKYRKVGGFNEDLQVAYNDVYFCFALYMANYYNVVRNDVIVKHYESLSRGNDHANQEKLERLKKERLYLYSHFPQLYGVDPFYSEALTGASEEYDCVLPFENRNIRPLDKVNFSNMPKAEVNETLIINVDHAEKEMLWKDMQCVLVDLHCHVRGLDNADYNFNMYLKQGENVLLIPTIRRIRPDVIKTFPDEINVELSGFVARIPLDYLAEGEYEIWMEAKSVFSRQVLINKAEIVLKV